MSAPTIRRRLAFLVLASAIPAVVLAAALLAYEHRRERGRLERDTIATARALVNAVDRELLGITVAAQVLSTSQRAQAGDLAAFYSQAQEVVAKGIGANVVLSDATGRQVMNTLRPLGEALPMHGNPVQVRAVFATGRPVVSDLYVGGVLRRPVMSVDVPVFSDGRVVHALSIGVMPERFRAILSEQKLPQGWIGAVFDTAGTVVARTQEHERFVGGKGAAELVERMAEEAEGALETATLEGIPVVSLFSRSPATGWSVALGIPRASLARPLWRRSAAAGAAAGAVLALGLALAWAIGGSIARSIRALSAPAAQIGLESHIEVPPLGLREADEVGQALVRASRMIFSAEHRAQHDPLTGLANRALFREMAVHQVELCKRSGAPLSILFIDLDGFKPVNDALGHESGDRLLCEVAARLKGALRASDLAARVGGDEFAVLLAGADRAAAALTAAKLAEVLSAPYEVGARSLNISASIGVASCPESGASAEELIRRADEAMYRVKSAGRRRQAASGA
jgi:diguanylate cyclase (GGDEF)-like protein